MTLTTILVLAAGTYALRAAGPFLRDRLEVSERLQRGLALAAVALLTALVLTQTFLDGQSFTGWARPAGVLVGGVAAWLRWPFVVVVLLAAGTAAGLRLLGVP
ncbi:branched-subunit amino acid transport protein [Crossiella equi]|uniref:Branched-subunit amino acid transport protein n=1 Tax=Crossiella equi TaxID=130796 RepID=A0ABS5ANK4_9PSEU|nr:AzlD domain-containing protein [Crossiella equi]MBP2478147.1 branched-subunit amino acid transport protein [Crossiella equi]